jgi:hypothetical protein
MHPIKAPLRMRGIFKEVAAQSSLHGETVVHHLPERAPRVGRSMHAIKSVLACHPRNKEAQAEVTRITEAKRSGHRFREFDHKAISQPPSTAPNTEQPLPAKFNPANSTAIQLTPWYRCHTDRFSKNLVVVSRPVAARRVFPACVRGSSHDVVGQMECGIASTAIA